MHTFSPATTIKSVEVNENFAECATLVGSEELTNKTITTPVIKTWDGWNTVSDSWAYNSADAPTFVITVPSGAASLYSPGMRIKLTQTTVKYFIITAVADTTLTVYGGTDYTLANAAISAIGYSTMKAPLGFPLDPLKWMVRITDGTNRSQASPGTGTWYNLGTTNAQVSVPIGAWKLKYSVLGYTTGATNGMYITLSTTNNSETLTDMTARIYAVFDNGLTTLINREKYIAVASKTVYYLLAKVNAGAGQTIYFINADDGDMVLEAICAYL